MSLPDLESVDQNDPQSPKMHRPLEGEGSKKTVDQSATVAADLAESERILEECSSVLVRLMNYRIKRPGAPRGVVHPLSAAAGFDVVEPRHRSDPPEREPILVACLRAESAARHFLRRASERFGPAAVAWEGE